MRHNLYPVIIDSMKDIYGLSDKGISCIYKYTYIRSAIYYNKRKISDRDLFKFIINDLNISVFKDKNGVSSNLMYDGEVYEVVELSSEILDNLKFRAEMEGDIDFKEDLEVVFKKGYSKSSKFRKLDSHLSYLMLSRLTILNSLYGANPSYTSGIEGFDTDVNHNPFKRTLEERLEVELKTSEHSKSHTTSYISEQDLEDYLVSNIELIEEGLKFMKRQVDVPGGFIDILAKDSNDNICIVEIKTSEDKSIVWQALHYPKEIRKQYKSKGIRMMTVAPKYSKPIYDALKSLDDVETLTYNISVIYGKISRLDINEI